MNAYQKTNDDQPALESIVEQKILSIIQNFKKDYPQGMDKYNHDEFESRILKFDNNILQYMLQHTKEIEILKTYSEYALLDISSGKLHDLEYIAQNVNAPKDILDKIARLGSYNFITAIVACNPSISTDTLKYMKRYCRDNDGKNAAIRALHERGEE